MTAALLEEAAPHLDLSGFVEHSADLICTHDLDGRILSANPAACAETFTPELVLLDVGLPDLDGTEVARRIQARRPETAVIFMTGHGDTEAEMTLHKPFDIDELFDRIAELERMP